MEAALIPVCPFCGMQIDVACWLHGVVETIERSVYVTFVGTEPGVEDRAHDQDFSSEARNTRAS